jgi:alkylation response protein AidB-like acyl-CoA dehydrogenase
MTTTTATAEETTLLRESIRGALDTVAAPDQVRRLMATAAGFDTAVWRRLAVEMGVAGLLVPEELGGAGLGVTELAIVLEEAGQTLACLPLYATAALAVPALLYCADQETQERYLPAICTGELTATLALSEDHGRWDLASVAATATPEGPRWRLTGVKNYVVDGASAGLLLVVAATAQGTALFAVEDGSPGLTRAPLVTLDQTRKQARLVLDGVIARRVGPTDPSRLDRALDVSRVLLAAEQVGGAQRCLDMTVRYAKDRVQFGRPIGSFQAVKQRLAEMLIRVESARSAAAEAAAVASAAGADEGLATVACVAKSYCSEAYVSVAADTIQLHGGIGFTWEHDAHLYYKRALSSAQLLGSPAVHVERLALLLAG